jgi:C4-dicarboxylate-specific signal transduction histidine kinase
MALGSIPTKARMRWVKLRVPRHPLPGRHARAAWARRVRHAGRPHGAGPRRGRFLRFQRERAIHLARVCLLGELSAAIVHELNQPLAAILANARAGRRRLAAEPGVCALLEDILDDIAEASQRAIGVIQRMRALFLRRGTLRQPVDLNTVARDAVALARSCLSAHGVRLALALDPRAVPLCGDAVQLQQVLLNLIMNACDALDANPPGARHIAIATAGGPGPRASLTVTDNGAGIAAARPERIFDSFFTTKPQGLGVGLAVAREIVAAHGGRIEAANRAEGGAVFRVTLPLAGERHDE